MNLTIGDMNWYTVGRYHLDGTVPIDAVVAELEAFGDVIDVDERTGHVMLNLDKPFLSTAKNLGELRYNARAALPRPRGCENPPEVVNATRISDMHVIDLWPV